MAVNVACVNPALLDIHPEVRQALLDRSPVVALESTICSTLGLPSPANGEVVDRCYRAIRSGGAVPAMTAIIDGRVVVGVDNSMLPRVLSSTTKCAERDIGIVLSSKNVGVTTVSGTLSICVAAGIQVFATGGIGGVHRQDHLTGDVSADVGAIARAKVITVTAGAKAFLDLSKTCELFDTLGVPVLGMQTDDFPAFYSRSSGVRIHHRIDTARDAARIATLHWSLNGGGVLVANPIPANAEIPRYEIEPAIEQALMAADHNGIRGALLTPFVLGKIAEVTGGRSIPANLALAENNARVATQIAVELAAIKDAER